MGRVDKGRKREVFELRENVFMRILTAQCGRDRGKRSQGQSLWMGRCSARMRLGRCMSYKNRRFLRLGLEVGRSEGLCCRGA